MTIYKWLFRKSQSRTNNNSHGNQEDFETKKASGKY